MHLPDSVRSCAVTPPSAPVVWVFSATTVYLWGSVAMLLNKEGTVPNLLPEKCTTLVVKALSHAAVHSDGESQYTPYIKCAPVRGSSLPPPTPCPPTAAPNPMGGDTLSHGRSPVAMTLGVEPPPTASSQHTALEAQADA